jgi:mannosyltransferase OCH1-like enzyme
MWVHCLICICQHRNINPARRVQSGPAPTHCLKVTDATMALSVTSAIVSTLSYLIQTHTTRDNATIPSLIFQSWRDVPLDATSYPVLESATTSWTKLNPEYMHMVFDDDAVRMYASQYWLQMEYNDPLYPLRPWVSAALDLFRIPAQRIDLWRLLVVYEYGGVYADIDTVCVDPIRGWLGPTACMASGIGNRSDIHQWVLVYSPRHPVISRAIKMIVDNVKRIDIDTLSAHIERYTGPMMLQDAYEEVLATDPTLRSCIQLFPTDQMGSHVQFKAEGYKEELQGHGRMSWFYDEQYYQQSEQYHQVVQAVILAGILLLLLVAISIRCFWKPRNRHTTPVSRARDERTAS